MYLPFPFIIWYYLLMRAELLLIFLLFSEPSLDMLLLRRLLRLEFLFELRDWRDWRDYLEVLEFYLLEAAAAYSIGYSGAWALAWFCNLKFNASMFLFISTWISDECDRTFYSSRALAIVTQITDKVRVLKVFLRNLLTIYYVFKTCIE